LSSESDGSDIESCFATEDEYKESDPDTELISADTDIDSADDGDGEDPPNLKWIVGEDNALPPEYYLD
jgi:hypothetical protein